MTTLPDHGKQAATGRYWPDRKAYLHRKRAHQAFYVLAVLVAVTPWFGYRYVRDAIHGDDPASSALQDVPTAAPARETGMPLPVHGGPDPASVARHISTIRAATAAGDDTAMRAGVDAMNTASRQAMRLVDPGRAVDREAARVAVQQLPDVRAAGWIDRTRLLVVASHSAGAEAMIETVCKRLEPLGDTVGVVVSVQNAATSGRPREMSRSCHSIPGAQVESQPSSASASTPTPTPSTRPQPGGTGVEGALPAHGEARLAPVEAEVEPAEKQEANEARNEESMRILEETTPEM